MSEATPKKRWLGRLFGGGDIPAPPPEVPQQPDLQPSPLPPELPPHIQPQPDIPGVPEPAPEIPVPPDAPKAEDAVEPPAAAPAKNGWLARVRQGLSRSSSRLTQGITDLFTKRRLDAAALEELEELLITADLGVATAARVTLRLAKTRFDQEISPDEVRASLAEEIATVLDPVARPLEPDRARKPHVVLVVGVNGSGKTTTIGKLAKYFRDQGLSVTLAAGDTFRAAAVEQLKIWGERTGCPVIAREQGADAAGLAFDALREAQRRQDDLLLIDTAGRLQNKAHLMAELQKIVRVLKKHDQEAPHDVLLVLDATVGQNAHSQVEIFKEMTDVSGLVVTKLDGTARGGVLVALAEKFQLPVHAIGVGEGADDLRPFEAKAYARSLMGLE
jgi:fused signal recognition particle receptor